MIITDCNCGEKLNCGCTLSFSSYVASSVSVLDVGTLQGGSCSFAKYVIDWYRDGEKYMVSGVGDDPEIQAYHPFTGTAAIPVIGGQYVPVLRYVVLTGQTSKIFTSKKPCQDWCLFAGSLPTITVSSLDCTSVNQAGDYQYRIAYLSTQDYALATRKILWNVGSTTKFLAFYFDAKVVADQLDIFYKDSTTPIASWIIGTNYNTYQYTTMPYNHKAGFLAFVIELPTFTTGDYYTIQVTPSVLETNINTDWALSIKCLTDSVDFEDECTDIVVGLREYDVSTITMVWNATACQYEMKLNLINNPSIIFQQTRASYDYLNLRSLAASSYIYNWSTAPLSIGVRLSQSKQARTYYYPSYASSSCTTANGTNNLAVSGSSIILTFDNDTDYLKFKNQYDAIVAAGLYTGWVNDNTDIEYYRHWQFVWVKTATQCGDNQTAYTILVHASATIIFTPDGGGGGTIELQMPTVTFGYTGDPTCDTVANTLQTTVNLYNAQLTNALALQGDTVAIYTTAGYGLSYYVYNNSIVNTYGGYALRGVKAVQFCDVANMGFCDGTLGNTDWYLYELRVKITATTDGNGVFTEDPVDNFEVWDMRDHTTGCRTTEYLIYKIEDGVQTFPIP